MAYLIEAGTNGKKTFKLENGVEGLTTAEVNQLKNINTEAITNAQWAYVGAFNQGLATTDNVTFNDVTTNGLKLQTGDTNETIELVNSGFPSGATNPTHGLAWSRTSNGGLVNRIFSEGSSGQDLGISARFSVNIYSFNTLIAEFSNSGLELTGTITSKSFLSAYKTTDETVASSTTLQDDDDLSLELEAGVTYDFSIHVITTSPVEKTKVAVAFTGTVHHDYFSAETYAANTRQLSESVSFTDTGAAGSNEHSLRISGTIEVNAAGTLKVQWAQVVSSATANTVHRGSRMTATVIA